MNFMLLGAAILGFTGVALGAFGAHALGPAIGPDALPIWKTAVQYHLLHAIALLALAAVQRSQASPVRQIQWAARCFLVGVLLFSGSLYWMALGGPRWLGPVTPLGGLALLIGWLLIAMAAVRRSDV